MSEPDETAGPRPDPVYRRMIQARLLVLYIINVIVLVVVFLYLGNQNRLIEQKSEEFRSAVINNCLKIQQNTIGFNEFIEKVQIRIEQDRRNGMTAQERAQWVAFYEEAKQEVADCPP